MKAGHVVDAAGPFRSVWPCPAPVRCDQPPTARLAKTDLQVFPRRTDSGIPKTTGARTARYERIRCHCYDWKDEYRSLVHEMEASQRAWCESEELLRRAARQIAIAGMGHSEAPVFRDVSSPLAAGMERALDDNDWVGLARLLADTVAGVTTIETRQ